MRIAVTDQARLGDFLVREGPWANFFEALEGQGHSIVSMGSNPQVIISMNVHRSFHNKYLRNIPPERRILVLWEPEAVRPENFNPSEISKFGLIFSPSKKWITGERVNYFNWPQQSQFSASQEWESRNKKFIAIWGNKFSFSPDSLYYLRRQVARNSEDYLEIYGRHWDSKPRIFFLACRSYLQVKGKLPTWGVSEFHGLFRTPKNYRGELLYKEDIMKMYQFSLVIENSRDYVSEKLFEALSLGLLPVYVGPKLSDFGIPDSIAVLAEPNLFSISEACRTLMHASKEDLRKLRDSAQNFLSSKDFKEFENTRVLSKLALDIDYYLKGTLLNG